MEQGVVRSARHPEPGGQRRALPLGLCPVAATVTQHEQCVPFTAFPTRTEPTSSPPFLSPCGPAPPTGDLDPSPRGPGSPSCQDSRSEPLPLLPWPGVRAASCSCFLHGTRCSHPGPRFSETWLTTVHGKFSADTRVVSIPQQEGPWLVQGTVHSLSMHRAPARKPLQAPSPLHQDEHTVGPCAVSGEGLSAWWPRVTRD